jgi:hypothetical protein
MIVRGEEKNRGGMNVDTGVAKRKASAPMRHRQGREVEVENEGDARHDIRDWRQSAFGPLMHRDKIKRNKIKPVSAPGRENTDRSCASSALLVARLGVFTIF